MEGAKSDSYVRTGKSSSERGNSFNDTERCPYRGTVCEGSVYIDHICEAQKGTKQVSNHYKPKEIKLPYALHPLQDGRDEKCIGPVKSGITW